MMPTLYHWEPNAGSLEVLLALHEKGIAFESRYVDFIAREAKTAAGLEGLTTDSYVVRSTINPALQRATEAALQEGLAHYETNAGRAQFQAPEANLADALGCDEGALRVQPVEEIPKAPAFLPDQIFNRDLEIVEEELARVVIDHVRDRPHRQAVFPCRTQIDEENRQSIGLPAHLVERRCPRKQDHQVGVLHAGDPHFLSVDEEEIPHIGGTRLQTGEIRACIRF